MKKGKLAALAMALALTLSGCNASDIFSYTLNDFWNDITSLGSEQRPEIEISTGEVEEKPSEEPSEEPEISMLDRIGLVLGGFFGGSSSDAMTVPDLDLDFDFDGFALDSFDETLPTINPDVKVPAMKETVLLDSDGVRVTANRLVRDDLDRCMIEVTVQNDRTDKVKVYSDSIAVNGSMCRGFIEGVMNGVGAGETKTAYLVLVSSSSDEIPEIGTLDLSVVAYGDDDSASMLGDVIHIETDQKDDMKTMELPREKEKVFDQDGVKVYLVSGIYDNNGGLVRLFVENNSKHSYLFTMGEATVEGESANFTMYTNFLPGTNGWLEASEYEDIARTGEPNCILRIMAEVENKEGRPAPELAGASHEIEVQTKLVEGDRYTD